MSAGAKARAERTLVLARALLVEEKVEVRGQVDLIPLAHILKRRAGVSYDTAKRHVHRAVMLARGELAAAPQWGGARVHPPPREKPAPKTVTIKAGSPIRVALTHQGGGYTHLGTGEVAIERSGADRIVRVELGDGSTLVLTVF